MASSFPAALASPPLELPPAFWTPAAAWGWPPAQGPPERARASPASSPESGAGSLSPAPPPGARRGRPRLGAGQRQSASQREKLRMRRLARALRTLRRFLPPALAPAGRSLTKVETLRLASRYIGHLAALLGPRPRPRPQPPARPCPLCPPGLGCCQRASPPLQAEPEPAAPAWPSPPCCLRPPAAPASGPAAPAWLPAAHCPAGAHVEDRAASRAPGDAAQPPPEDLWPQDLPAELLAFLESLLPPEAQA